MIQVMHQYNHGNDQNGQTTSLAVALGQYTSFIHSCFSLAKLPRIQGGGPIDNNKDQQSRIVTPLPRFSHFVEKS